MSCTWLTRLTPHKTFSRVSIWFIFRWVVVGNLMDVEIQDYNLKFWEKTWRFNASLRVWRVFERLWQIGRFQLVDKKEEFSGRKQKEKLESSFSYQCLHFREIFPRGISQTHLTVSTAEQEGLRRKFWGQKHKILWIFDIKSQSAHLKCGKYKKRDWKRIFFAANFERESWLKIYWSSCYLI